MAHPASTTLGAAAPVTTPTLSAVNGTATALSTDVANHFGKRHDNVVRDIEALLQELPADRLLNFEEVFVEYQNGGGATQKARAYRLTRDGFTLLAMGFTGKKALAFKLAYLDAFNRMEAELAGRALGQSTGPQTYTPSLKNRRWLISFDHTGREVVQSIDWDDCLLKYEELPKLLAANDNMVASTLLVSIANACLQRLGKRASAEYAKGSAPAKGGVL